MRPLWGWVERAGSTRVVKSQSVLHIPRKGDTQIRYRSIQVHKQAQTHCHEHS